MTVSTPTKLLVPHTDTSSLIIAPSPESVYAALVDRDALTAWLAPAGMSGRFERFDLRPGGSYRMVLSYDDPTSARGKATADSDIIEARVIVMVPGQWIVLAVDFVADDPGLASTRTMTWAMTAVEGGTRVEVTAEDVPDGVSAEDHAAGLNSSLANLAGYLED